MLAVSNLLVRRDDAEGQMLGVMSLGRSAFVDSSTPLLVRLFRGFEKHTVQDDSC
jgi:hypothetical protein